MKRNVWIAEAKREIKKCSNVEQLLSCGYKVLTRIEDKFYHFGSNVLFEYPKEVEFIKIDKLNFVTL